MFAVSKVRHSAVADGTAGQSAVHSLHRHRRGNAGVWARSLGRLNSPLQTPNADGVFFGVFSFSGRRLRGDSGYGRVVLKASFSMDSGWRCRMASDSLIFCGFAEV